MAKNEGNGTRLAVLADDGPVRTAESAGLLYRAASKRGLHSQTARGEKISRPAEAPRGNAEADGDEDEEVFLRARSRVPVRRGLLPRSRIGRIAAALGALAAFGLLLFLGYRVARFFRSDPRFRIESSSSIQMLGNSEVSRRQLLAVFSADIGRNIFLVPLNRRRAALEELPWVEHATVMRLLPNQLRVAILERTPIAFVRVGNSIGLIDANGVILNLPPAIMSARRYSFPVVAGISAADPPSLRAARMQLYRQFIGDLDSGAERVSDRISEVDVSDPEDIRALLPAQGSDIQVHFGDSDFLARYRRYREHLAEWRQQYPQLASVDLRYDNQAVLEMRKAEMRKTAGAAAGRMVSGDGESSASDPGARTTRTKAQPRTNRKAAK